MIKVHNNEIMFWVARTDFSFVAPQTKTFLTTAIYLISLIGMLGL